jgi:hypothetical protein
MGTVRMKKMLQYTRQVSQRRLFAFELAQQARDEEAAERDPVQLSFHNTHLNEVEGHVLRRKIADLEYDDE